MSTQADKLHWEDFTIGRRVSLGRKTVTREEIIAFAAEFDPQPFHLDDDAAKETLLGGLAASGWHSCAMLMRMICDGYLLNATSLGSPGIDEVKWMKPVRPEDCLEAFYTCSESRPLESRPGVGMCKFHYELINQNDEIVMTWDCNQFFNRRESGTAA